MGYQASVVQTEENLRKRDTAQSLVADTRRPGLYEAYFKRVFDILFSIVVLPVALPLGLCIAVLVKLDSKGPVMFKHWRVGRGGKCFGLFKFRTMVVNADEVLQKLLESDPEVRKEYESCYKIKNDPRITRIGRWLRKYSLDELPQILNVLRGEMSWVGPRPLIDPELKGKYDRRQQELLLSVRPGITGLWQISGRAQLSYAERVQLEMEYIRRISFMEDVRIILRTIPEVFIRRNTY